jgi:hypothetical protein
VCATPTAWAVVDFQRNLILRSVSGGRGINIFGVDFWHAVEFSRNGRFLCSCFTRISGRFPSVLRFRLYQILAGPIFAGAFPPFGFFAFPTLPDPFPSLAPVGAGRPFCFRFPAFPTLPDSISFRFRPEFVSDYPSEGVRRGAAICIAAPFGVITTLAEFLVDA